MMAHKGHTGDTGTAGRLLRASDVLALTGLPSAARIYHKMADDDFPKQVKIGDRSVAWVESEVLEWQRKKIAERDKRLAEKAKEKADAQG